MSEFTPARLAELKAVAEAATPGPWQWMDGGVFHSTSFGWQPVTLPGESAQYIAAFDPPTVLRLIAALEAANVRKTGECFTCGAQSVRKLGELSDEHLEELELLGIQSDAVIAVIDGYYQLTRALEAKTAEVDELRAWKKRVIEQVRDTTTGQPSPPGTDYGELIDRLKRERDEARAALERVRALHKKRDDGWCVACSEVHDDGTPQDWPCPTIQATQGAEQ